MVRDVRLRIAKEVLTELIQRPSYGRYLTHKLFSRLGLVEPNARMAGIGMRADALRTQLERFEAGNSNCASEGSTHSARVRDKLFKVSPYRGFDPENYAEDLQGWGSDDPVLVEAIQLLRPTRICEVGSWKGRSAINMAKVVKSLHLNAEIVCVDTWLGSPEHWLDTAPGYYDSLVIRNGLPQLYYTFLTNVVRHGVADIVTPFPTTSENAAVVFADWDVRFDLIYIDAAHEYEPARRDIETYFELLRDDGLLIGDDYIDWPGVTRAADTFAAERQLRLIGKPGKFIIPKGVKFSGIYLKNP